MKDVLQSLKCRSAWYEKAIRMAKREIPWENGFDWPRITVLCVPIYSNNNIRVWESAKKEIDNTIDMMEHVLRMEDAR